MCATFLHVVHGPNVMYMHIHIVHNMNNDVHCTLLITHCTIHRMVEKYTRKYLYLFTHIHVLI